MINHGFRRLALAHNLLPATVDLPTDQAYQPRDRPVATRVPAPGADALDDDTPSQDHPSIHM